MAVLTLKTPVRMGKITVDKLNFRDHTTAADYLSFDIRGGVAQRISLIASLTGTDEEVIKNLSGRDYLAAEKIADAMIAADSNEEPGEDATEKK